MSRHIVNADVSARQRVRNDPEEWLECTRCFKAIQRKQAKEFCERYHPGVHQSNAHVRFGLKAKVATWSSRRALGWPAVIEDTGIEVWTCCHKTEQKAPGCRVALHSLPF